MQLQSCECELCLCSEPSSQSASAAQHSNGFPPAAGGSPPGMARPSPQQMKDMAAQLKANPAMAEAVFNVSPEQMEMMVRFWHSRGILRIGI